MLNKISCDYIGISSVLTFFSIFWFGYNKFIRPENPKTKHLMSGCAINIPRKYQYMFPVWASRFNGKTLFENCLDRWSVGHFIIYFFSGLLFPNRYYFVLLLSIFCEFFEYFAGFRGRLSDLFVNLFGYFIGSMCNRKINNDWKEWFCENKNTFILCFPVMLILLILLYINRNPKWV